MGQMLSTALASAAEQGVSESNAQSLANTAWAFAKGNRSDENLSAALAKALQQRLCEFNVQNLANAA